MRIAIVLPTYNERGNITPLIEQIIRTLTDLPHQFQIVVVDDNSPDGTARMVGSLKEKTPNLHLLVGKKKGLGAAYIRGFTFAQKQLAPDIIVEMDADLSHDPQELPKLITEIESGADFVIGSRYVKGGKIPKNWNFFRKANSKWGNRFARYLAGIDDVVDCTSGYRVIKNDVLKKIDLNKLKVRGYSFQMNLLYKAYVGGARIKEVPINFKERVWGSTKLGSSDIIEFMWNSVKLRFEQGLTGLDKKALRADAKKKLADEGEVASL